MDQQIKNMNAKRILVIDDHVLFREGLIGLFRSNPDFVVVADVGTVFEGIEKARLYRPDIILMDFSLPDGTGLDATRAILPILPDCKIIFLTVYETEEKLVSAIRLGAKGYMLKNIAGSNLISSLYALERGELAFSRKMMSQAISYLARDTQPAQEQENLLSRLSGREMDVLKELDSGATNLEIAQHLFLSENTVKHHIRNILNKLKLKNRREAASLARQYGLTSTYQPKNTHSSS